jgi:hypothetical protein
MSWGLLPFRPFRGGRWLSLRGWGSRCSGRTSFRGGRRRLRRRSCRRRPPRRRPCRRPRRKPPRRVPSRRPGPCGGQRRGFRWGRLGLRSLARFRLCRWWAICRARLRRHRIWAPGRVPMEVGSRPRGVARRISLSRLGKSSRQGSPRLPVRWLTAGGPGRLPVRCGRVPGRMSRGPSRWPRSCGMPPSPQCRRRSRLRPLGRMS